MTIERRNVGPRLSDLVIYAPPPSGRLVFLAGQVGEDRNADIAGQTRSVLDQIDRLLAEAGSDKRHILSATIYLADMKDYAAMNAVYGRYFEAPFPARTAIAAAALPLGAAVKIEIVAA